VYILTSRKTFSAGEALPYALQSLQRAMVVGEPTLGGAHSGDLVRINEHFAAFIPVEYARNPVTQTNWEGTGVQPDLKISAEQSVRQAYGLALQTLLGGAVDANRRRVLVQLIERVQQLSDELNSK
jgi:C-terminal processing protease CtpA/Prc